MSDKITLVANTYRCRNCGKLFESNTQKLCNVDKEFFKHKNEISDYIKFMTTTIKHHCFADIIGIADIASFKIEEVE